jgi:DNA-binding HxlR family transcriptional regulator
VSSRCQIQTAFLIALFHHRWAAPLLATLHSESGAKFVTLANRLGLSRDSLRQTLAALTAQGLVMRNPGYGHPLRPEYILTPAGDQVGFACGRLLDAARALGIDEIVLRKWPVPVLWVLQEGSLRFGEARAALPGVTSRALALTLKELQGAGLVERLLLDSYPPVAEYRLTHAGGRLAAAAPLHPGHRSEVAPVRSDAPDV